MRVKTISVTNFRLLENVSISLDPSNTLIVGRNNTGKTSLTELVRRISHAGSSFRLEDFSLKAIDGFWAAYVKFLEGSDENVVRSFVPYIGMKMEIDYTEDDFYGLLSELIIDLDPDNFTAVLDVSYRLENGSLDRFFGAFEGDASVYGGVASKAFCRTLAKQIPKRFVLTGEAVDPTASSANRRNVDMDFVRKLLMCSFITAQRGLDDSTLKEKDVLGKVLLALFSSIQKDEVLPSDQQAREDIAETIESIQGMIDASYNGQVSGLLPALSLFGYPGLSDPGIHTETTIDSSKFLEAHTRICYAKSDCEGISLPETYSGLGTRNLLYILFQLYRYFKDYAASQPRPLIHLVFIEEPEAHLHPQMQEIFIRQIVKIADEFKRTFEVKEWSVQFVVTTHSTHIANAAHFDTIRYFIHKDSNGSGTRIKDLSTGLGGPDAEADRDFLQKYLTLTRCDLFFADKAILVEGQSEHLLLPRMLEMIDECAGSRLSAEYISIVEVGGAYVHKFFPLLDFLELRTLVITDLDSVKTMIGSDGKKFKQKCPVSEGEDTSNEGLKKWFSIDDELQCPFAQIWDKGAGEKMTGYRRIAFQIPEEGTTWCARSFEDAFILANPGLFGLSSGDNDLERKAFEEANKSNMKKLDFAIRYAVLESTWEIPIYIKEGLKWLCNNSTVGTLGEGEVDG